MGAWAGAGIGGDVIGMLVVVVIGGVFVCAAVMWRGGIRRPFAAMRAGTSEVRLGKPQLKHAADLAISRARGAARPGEPAVVRVDEVLGVLADHFGGPDVPRHVVAAALRRRFEAGGCRADCVTDAFD
ncbi:hypothetical protein DSC45_20110 [Streptomyces sp. YIM 130001]|uniref:hypothetical protein n=1 Tax=Streptomyces sp. YIM 130001 TaxID=2259644 RepID=UPI000E65B740|nr:hypothetical protein [Streptomyces sp. YIM 130001]RII14659.1 hypothetical protein DSC45_20110 [Streptomyces sp. YIM 130001]